MEFLGACYQPRPVILRNYDLTCILVLLQYSYRMELNLKMVLLTHVISSENVFCFAVGNWAQIGRSAILIKSIWGHWKNLITMPFHECVSDDKLHKLGFFKIFNWRRLLVLWSWSLPIFNKSLSVKDVIGTLFTIINSCVVLNYKAKK